MSEFITEISIESSTICIESTIVTYHIGCDNEKGSPPIIYDNEVDNIKATTAICGGSGAGQLENQDGYLFCKFIHLGNEYKLMLVVDGHGISGKIVKDIIIDNLSKIIIKNFQTILDNPMFLQECINEINEIIRENHQNDTLIGGAVFVFALELNDNQFAIVQLGDCEIFHNGIKLPGYELDTAEIKRVLSIPYVSIIYDTKRGYYGQDINVYKLDDTNEVITPEITSHQQQYLYACNTSGDLAKYITFNDGKKQQLAVSKALANFDKPFISNIANISIISVNPGNTLFLCSDGVTASMTEKEISTMILEENYDCIIPNVEKYFGNNGDNTTFITIKI